jgi:hypothetical protein
VVTVAASELSAQAVNLNIREGRLQKNSILEKLDVLQIVVGKLKLDASEATADDSFSSAGSQRHSRAHTRSLGLVRCSEAPAASRLHLLGRMRYRSFAYYVT